MYQNLSHVPNEVIPDCSAEPEIVAARKRPGGKQLTPTGISADYWNLFGIDCCLTELRARGRIETRPPRETYLEYAARNGCPITAGNIYTASALDSLVLDARAELARPDPRKAVLEEMSQDAKRLVFGKHS